MTPPDGAAAGAAAREEVRTTTCYMCACRCGIRVHLKDGAIRFIDGNPDHPVNRGVLCAKGSAGIMHQHSPAKLTAPLRRVGPRGSGRFEVISWDEALATATQWLSEIRWRDPRGLAFFTGRDQSQSLTGFWAQQFGTPNFAAHGGFCSVNMAAAGLYTIGGSFWEFGEPDWERTRYLLMFGVAEDHDSNPIKAGIGKLKARAGTKFVSVNPVRTGYSAVADEWVPIRPGTDGAFVLSLVHEILRTRRVDLDWLARYTDAGWLVERDPGGPRDGLVVRDRDGAPMVYDRRLGRLASAGRADAEPALTGTYPLHQAAPGDAGGAGSAMPVFALLAERYLDAAHAPEAAEKVCGVPAATIRRIAAELAEAAFEGAIELDQPWTDVAGRRHATTTGRPVAMHAMRGISAHANGFHTCRAIHVLQMLLGAIDCPGAFRYKPPFPRPCPPGPKPAGRPDQVHAGRPMAGPPLGFVAGPEDLLVDGAGRPARIDRAFSWEHPVAAHGMMHMVIRDAWAGDPYKVDLLFLYMANMAWNSAMNTAGTIDMLADTDPATGEYRIPRIIVADAFWSETVPYADLVLPDTTYLERWDCISLLDRPISSADGPADAIRQPILKPDRDVRPFQDVLLDLGARLGLPAFTTAEGTPRYPGGYADYIVNHERAPGIGPLAGWRGADGQSQGRGTANPDQLARYVANGCHWQHELEPGQRWYRFANRDYLDYARSMGWVASVEAITLRLWCEPLQRFRLAAMGHAATEPPAHLRERIRTYFDPLPIWYPPPGEALGTDNEYPLHAITQRPMAMYHSWGSQNAWLRQIHGWNRLYVNRRTAERLGLADDDWVWIESRNGRVKAQIRAMEGCEENTVWTWNAIGKRAGAWNLAPDAPEATRGFLLNHLIDDLAPAGPDGRRLANADPVTGQAAWFDLRVRLVKALPEEAGTSAPQFPAMKRPDWLARAPRLLQRGARFLKGVDRSALAPRGDGR
ncbi:MAG: molybdopterin oxidoreductase family protein [Alphaproteobacteria bacterium]